MISLLCPMQALLAHKKQAARQTPHKPPWTSAAELWAATSASLLPFRPVIRTLAPFSTSPVTIALPIQELPPDTIATLLPYVP